MFLHNIAPTPFPSWVFERIANSVNAFNSAGTPVLNSPVVLVGSYDGATSLLSINGIINTLSATTASTAGTLQFAVFARSDGTGLPFNGDIAEVLVYNRALSIAERQSIEAYLGSKWGITVANAGGPQLQFPTALPSAPSAGDQVQVWAGCNKTMDNCLNKFNNIKSYRGFPFVPRPESIYP
jgi:hypothetical protein